LFGPSGSGKSTLVNIIAGLETVTSGNVSVDGQKVKALSHDQRAEFHRKKIGMVFQSYNLISSLTVLQNITLPQIFSKVDKQGRNKKAKKLLKDFGLEDLSNRLPTEISGGQAQRVGIMRALINQPPIIIADEPTGNLDSEAAQKVMTTFSNLNDKYGNTLIVVTHDASLFNYADRIIHMLDGKVQKDSLKQSKKKKSAKIKKKIPYDIFVEKETDSERKHVLNLLDAILTRHHLSSFDEQELELAIKFILQKINNKIDWKQLYELLDKPISKGGAGLYEPTAKNMVSDLKSISKLKL
jgi:putative ABC transport system ATP-binding protein